MNRPNKPLVYRKKLYSVATNRVVGYKWVWECISVDHIRYMSNNIPTGKVEGHSKYGWQRCIENAIKHWYKYHVSK